MIWALGIAALLAGLWTGFVFFANGMRSGSGKFVGAGTIWAAWLVVLILLVLLVAPAKAHDHSKPHLNDWLKSLHSKSKVWCCDGKDYDPIDDWETKDGGYRVKFRGQWFDVPEGAIIDGSNKAGDAPAVDEQGVRRLVSEMLHARRHDVIRPSGRPPASCQGHLPD